MATVIGAAAALLLVTACGSGTEDAASRVTLSVEGDTVVIRNRSDGAVRVAGAVGLEIFEDGEWVDARPLLERITGTVVVSTLEIFLLDGGEDARRPVPLHAELPPGRYRVTAAYSGSDRGPLREVARATFTK